MFYKAIIQSVLLYGSELWNISSPMLKLLKGFHHRIARRLSGLMPRRHVLPGGEEQWEYPPIDSALDVAGLRPMEDLIQSHQNQAIDYITTRPIFDLCINSRRLPGSSRLQGWWDQLV